LQAVKKERARRTPEVGIEFVARRSNLTELPKLLALARELTAIRAGEQFFTYTRP
jgi:hypothetical protein